MRATQYIISAFLILILSSFNQEDKYNSEYTQLKKLELNVLKRSETGKDFFYDLTNRKGCNKTSIKFLGLIKTKSGKHFKVLNSFFVSSSSSSCQGTSNIKIYDLNNKYVGRYSVEMPYDLPVKINDNKFVCWNNSQECNSRNNFEINFGNGLPKIFFLPCSITEGYECSFIGN